LPHGFGRNAADLTCFRDAQPLDANEQQRFPIEDGKRSERRLDTPLAFRGRGRLERRRLGCAAGPESDEAGDMRVFHHARPAVAGVEVARDRKQPWTQTRVLTECGCACDQPEPGFFEQILSDISPPGEPGEEVEQGRVEVLEHGIERGRVSRAKAGHQRQLGVPVHTGQNAHARES
jgi:hypothetical protein